MRRLRHVFVQRSVCFGLLLSLGSWLAVPATAAPSLAQELGLPGEFDGVLAEALADAPSPEAFVERLATTLAEGESADALADLLETEPDALLSLLYGHLFQAFGYHTGLDAVPTTTSTVAAGTALYAKNVPARASPLAAAPRTIHPSAAASAAARPAVCLTAAQPLGP